MDRTQLYNEINTLKLKEKAKTTYGKSYTNCSNAELETLIANETKELNQCCNPSCCFDKLIEVLSKKKILLKSEVEYIMKFN